MVKRRALSLTEVLVASSLLLVLLGAAAPSPRAPALALLERADAERARLLVEGELTLLRQEAARGELAPGRWARDARRWASAAGLPDLAVVAEVTDAGDGLLEVVVEARWRSRAAPGPQALRLGALAARGRAP
ncbi:MAG: hypothetical protein M9894_32745 [Planctomycetes bacterium]|nr:hypothetical protein [Planctomycetota bacterium]